MDLNRNKETMDGSPVPMAAQNSPAIPMRIVGKFTKFRRISSKIFRFIKKIKSENWLLLFTIFSVVLGIAIGVGIKQGSTKDPPMTSREIYYLNFPGEIFLRMLKLTILPLIFSSLINSMTSLDSKSAGKIGAYTIAYYLATTIIAVITGIILVVSIRPGNWSSVPDYLPPLDKSCEGGKPLDTVMDLFRNMIPENIVSATFESVRTCFVFELIEGNKSRKISEDAAKNLTRLENDRFKIVINPEQQTKGGLNVLGIVVFAIVFGMILSRYRKHCQPLIDIFRALEYAIMKLVKIVIWMSPIGITFLIASQIVGMKDLRGEVQRLGMYMVTVLVGLFIHGCITIPVLLFLLGRRNPFKYCYGMLQAYLTAFGTASSSATMPLTLKCLEDNNKIDPRITQFMIPLGATVNMDGTALYEAVAAIYIAQTIGQTLNIGQVILISLTATLASIGAAGIPQAGLVTMIMVLISVDLPAKYFVLITPVDWFLDRIRTAINVHGDSCGAGIVETLCKRKLDSFKTVTANGHAADKINENGV